MSGEGVGPNHGQPITIHYVKKYSYIHVFFIYDTHADCILKDLGNATHTEIEYPMCRSSVSSASISGGAVCLNGTTVGSNATYVCNDGYNLMGNKSRVCQMDGNWNGRTPRCIPEKSSMYCSHATQSVLVDFDKVIGFPK